MKIKRQIRSRPLPAVLLVLGVLVVAAPACDGETVVWPEPTATAMAGLPDLVVAIEGPDYAKPGEELKDSILVEVANVGDAPARGFSVGLYFSPDKVVDQRDPLLVGGREFVEGLGPGEAIVVPLNGRNELPKNSLPGAGFLGVIVDESQTVVELDERNNTAVWSIRIEG